MCGNVIDHRLDNVQPSVISLVDKSNMARAIKLADTNFSVSNSTGCIMEKIHRSAIPKKSKFKPSQLLGMITSDVNGPIETHSLGGSTYFITFLVDYSKCTIIYTMKAESDMLELFKKFHAFTKKHTGSNLRIMNVIERKI